MFKEIFVILTIILAIIVFYLYEDSFSSTNYLPINDNIMYNIPIEDKTRDCFMYPTTCFSNKDCSELCIGKATSILCDLDLNICSETTTEEEGGGEDPIEKPTCNLKLGIFPILIGYNSLGLAQWECKSLLYPQLIDDYGNIKSYVCNGGILNINLLENPWDVKTICKCSSNSTLYWYENRDPYTPLIPRCSSTPQLFYKAKNLNELTKAKFLK